MKFGAWTWHMLINWQRITGIKYLLVRQDVFDKTIDVRGLETKDSKEALRAFTQMITKRKRPQKIWVDKGKEFAGEFKKFCDREGIQIYSTMSETKAAFAESYSFIEKCFVSLY